MFKYCYCVIAIIASLLISKTVTGTNSDSVFKILDTITVTSRQWPNKKELLPYSYTVKKAIQIENFRTTPEALMGASGVFIQKTNHGGGAAFIRGLTGNQTLIILDGIRLNNATYRYGPNQYLNTIDVYTIDEVEVFKGTGAVEYGSDAMGGVVYIHSKTPKYSNSKGIHGEAIVKLLGEKMEKTVRTSIEISREKFALQAGVSIKKFGDLIGGAGIGTQSPSGYAENGFDFKMKFKVSNTDELIASSKLLIQNDVPIYHKIILENYLVNKIAKQTGNLNYLKWIKKTNQHWFKEIHLTPSFQISAEARENNKNNSNTYKYEKDIVNTTGINLDILSTPSANWRINSGIDYYYDKIESNIWEKNLQSSVITLKRGLYPNASSSENISVFNLHKVDINKWHIEGGIRWNKYVINLYDSAIGHVSISPTALVGNGGITYSINTENNLYTSIASGFRAPNVDDMGSLGIVDFRYEIPASNLKPEKSVHYELGYRYTKKTTKIQLSLFYLSLKDIINRQKITGQIINGYQVYEKKNAESSFIKGFEFNAALPLSTSLSWTANLTYTYGQNVTKNEPMRRIPPVFGQQEFTWKRKNTQLQLNHLFAGKQDRLAQGDIDDNRIGTNGTPNWNVLNLMWSKQFNKIQFQLGALNLLNEKYKTHGSGIYGMGRTYSVQIKVSY
ncbi:MAG: hypothetical protein RL363_1531 [Bacteroidota bacterium]